VTDYATYPAIVTNINDPEKRGRIKVKCAALLDEEQELPDWIRPEFHFVAKTGGWFGIPAKDSGVEIKVPERSIYDEVPWEQSLQAGFDIRWVCTAYNPKQPLPKVFETNYPERSGYVWPNGWAFFTDSKTGEAFWMYYDDDNATPKHFVQIDKNGNIRIKGTAVLIGGDDAQESMALGDALYQFLNTVATGWGASHVHDGTSIIAPPGGGACSGATGVPTPGMDTPVQADLVSGKHKVEK
jgi:hypothetical protein